MASTAAPAPSIAGRETTAVIPDSVFVVLSGTPAKIQLKTYHVSKRIVHFVPAAGSAPGLDEITVVSPPGTTVVELWEELLPFIIEIYNKTHGGSSGGDGGSGGNTGGGSGCFTKQSSLTLPNGTIWTSTETICPTT